MPPVIVCVGEIVWDLLPAGPRLGGSPANVAIHAAALGDRAVLVSRVGIDELGQRALSALAERGVDASAVTRDPVRPTGTVAVRLEPAGDVHFTIDAAAAWTALGWDEALAAVAGQANALCFGTLLLGAGGEGACALLRRVTAISKPDAWRLIDLNLRPPFDTERAIEAGLAAANAVKINEAEEARLAEVYGVEDPARWLLAERGMRLVAVTRGEAGSALLTTDGEDLQPALPSAPVAGADPVGAGDAFVAALLHHLAQGSALAVAHRAAAELAGFVAGQPGATPRPRRK